MVDSTNVQINLFVVDPKVLETWIICEISPSTSVKPGRIFHHLLRWRPGSSEIIRQNIVNNPGHNSGEVQLEFLRY